MVCAVEAPYILTNMRKILKLFSRTSSCTRNNNLSSKKGIGRFWTKFYKKPSYNSSPHNQTYSTIGCLVIKQKLLCLAHEFQHQNIVQLVITIIGPKWQRTYRTCNAIASLRNGGSMQMLIPSWWHMVQKHTVPLPFLWL